MSVIKKYQDYIRDNPEGYWFKRKIYGWGWTPARWQGWVVTLLYVVLVVLFSLTIDETSPLNEVVFTFVLPTIFLTVTLISIAYKKGEKPKWMWGIEKDQK